MHMQLPLRLLAPYLAVGIFWCGLSNAWLAILAYHAQILFWSRLSGSGMWKPVSRKMLLLALPTALTGPLLYYLLPCITGVSLQVWLGDHRLSETSFLLMMPYFGLVHPILEQLHWETLRERTPWAHVLFAGYHMLVLGSLLTGPWLAACFVVLTAASFLWRYMTRKGQGVTAPMISHVLADTGIVIAAWFGS